MTKNTFVTSDFSSAFKKASDVIIASKPSDFKELFKKMLSVSEQPFKAMIATRGFIPDTNTIPYLAAVDLLKESDRRDVNLYTLTSPFDPEDLVESRLVKGRSPYKMLSKIQGQYENDGIHLQSLLDMESALNCAKQYNLKMPVLEEAVETFRNTTS